MDYYQLVGVCKTIVPPVRLEGIGDMPLSDGAIMITHKPCGKLPRRFKVDQYSSFPKGLPRAFRLAGEHLRD